MYKLRFSHQQPANRQLHRPLQQPLFHSSALQSGSSSGGGEQSDGFDAPAPAPLLKDTERSEIDRARKFVNRTDELRFVRRQIQLLREGGATQTCVINFHGVTGIGKSALLGHISDQWWHDERLAVLELDLKPIFSPRPKANSFAARLAFLHSLACTDHLPLKTREQLELRLASVDAGGEQDSSRQETLLDEILDAITDRLQAAERRLVLIFDSWDYAPDVFPPWIEQRLLIPLLLKGKAIAIFSSQTTLRWWRPETRRKARAQRLGALSKEDSAQQVDLPVSAADELYQLTFGYPLANEYVHQALQQSGVSLAGLSEQQSIILHQVIEGIQERMHQVTEHTSLEVWQIIGVVALFREFDVSTLREILPHFYPEFNERSQSSLLITLGDLLATRLIAWRDDVKAYTIESPIRSILTQYLRETSPQRYREIRDRAQDYYREQFQDVPENRPVYAAEFCYHALYKYENDFYNDVDSVAEQLMTLLGQVYGSSGLSRQAREQLEAIRARVVNDEDLAHALRVRQLPKEQICQTLDAWLASA